ncbi:S41 family peptidase [Marinilongibacter aquaticus]|uniref:S41 family peptidase n=1 Tax=Marinilongibacter aquaticus TaxID=2975157 RepID=UPI0021BDC334|nr:S41 family peptidase [Marinilongibacter aquaticus]UBM60205.1 S41 family peptidase [Marinilongibacter aquaticus]
MINPNLKTIAQSFGLFLLFSISNLYAQAQEKHLEKEDIALAVDSIAHKLQANYVFPKVAEAMAKKIKSNWQNAAYNTVTDPEALARQLTQDLQSVSKDKHLMVVYNPEVIAREQALTSEDRAKEASEWEKELLQHLKQNNFGFRDVKILDDNIGYLDLREFANPEYAGETLTAAMQFLSNSKAIIIDLRQNDGGFPGMVQLLASYFFPSEPVHLADHYNRPKNESTQSWTLPYVPGTRRPNVDLYILTSNKTFSAAEAFTFQMQIKQRATVIGETTAGGAHLTGSVIATDKYYVRIPQGRTMSPVDQSDWEGKGIKPDISTSAAEALETANQMARQKLKTAQH